MVSLEAPSTPTVQSQLLSCKYPVKIRDLYFKTSSKHPKLYLAVYGGTFQNHYASSLPLSKTDKRRWQEAEPETVCSLDYNGASANKNWSGIGAVQDFTSARPICSFIGHFYYEGVSCGSALPCD